MRRFGQIIRQPGHFGKQPLHLNSEHQVQYKFPALESIASRGANAFRLDEGAQQMIDYDGELKARRAVTLFFAFLAATTAVSTAIAPAILNF
jgi:hypothetical protein